MQETILIYDGNCGLCIAWVNWVKQRDIHRLLRPIPCSEDIAKLNSIPVAEEECRQEFKLVLEGGRILGGGDAIPYVLLALPGYRVLGKILRTALFRPFLRWSYRRVAQNRKFISAVLGEDWQRDMGRESK